MNRGGDHGLDDGDVERHPELVHAVFDRVVVRSEVLVGEALADEHALPAVRRERRMVAATFDGTVVRVDGLEVEAVLLDDAEQHHRHLVAAVLVHVVVNVEHVLFSPAVADHVELPHVDDVLVGGLARLRVLLAAPEPLLFAGEVQEANFDVVREDEVLHRFCDLQHGDGAGAVVISARSELLVAPGVAGGRVEVRTEDVDLRLGARHLAGHASLEVEQRLTADLVGHALELDLERAVELFEPGHGQPDARTMSAAALEGDVLIADVNRLLTSQSSNQFAEFRRVNAAEELLNEGLRGRDVRHVDGRRHEVRGAAHFGAAELAGSAVFVGVLPAAVNGIEILVRRDDGAVVDVVAALGSDEQSANQSENCQSDED